ncbi:T-cell surface protein tactile isoform X2 [Thalassophryne amazonica]|uniref:T-cell surface protein tactile isoform X2 n=1 Tax=Thalassophryne amazonica TaxID=390379 RepID=UPI001470E9FB|nr:T-cell surface protein tactile isoform X2 [Thalassophryne amazonica]
MSLGSLDMSGVKLGPAFSLLLLSSITQGVQVVDVFHYKVKEAVVGQNVTLLCIIRNRTGLDIVQYEWNKNNTMLALYSKNHGLLVRRPNISLQSKNGSNIATGSYLQIFGVQKHDSGIYICDITTFPWGAIRRETRLIIKDADKLVCDANKTVEVQTGQNVTIRCNSSSHAQYRWIKDKKLVSDTEFLELTWVTDAQAGNYSLTVNTGSQTLQTEFVITVLTATTNLQTGLLTVSRHSNIAKEGLIESTKSSLTTSSTSGIPTHSSVTRTTDLGTNGTSNNPNNVTMTDGDHAKAASFTHHTYTGVTTSSAAYPTTDDSNTSSGLSLHSDLSTDLGYGSSVFRSTPEVASKEMMNEKTSPPVVLDKDADHARRHLMLGFLLLFVVLFITVAGVLYRRKVMKARMDRPPPFKPPPPPVKYSAVRSYVA